jgi:hypothetical protein
VPRLGGRTTSRDEVEAALLEVQELLHLHVERKGDVARERGGTGDGEVGAAGEIGPQGLQVRAQVAHVQAFTCCHVGTHHSTLLVTQTTRTSATASRKCNNETTHRGSR